MIIDAHTHIGKLSNSKFSESHEKNLSFLLQEMKENNVDHAIVLAGFGKHDNSSSNISTRNLIGLAHGLDNIHIMGSIDVLQYQKDDLDQLEKWMKGGEIIGLKLYIGYQHFYPYDERCKPLYELCLKYNLPVLFHSGDTLPGVVPNPKIKYAHPIHIDEVATDLPELKIIIAHLGNPWLIDCAEVLYKNKNVYADISSLVLGGDFATPLGELTRKRIQDLLVYAEGNKLLYGTDWPLCRMSPYLTFVRNFGLSQEELDKTLYKNAVEVFKLQI